MLQPVVRRTWTPRGQTPIHYSWDRRDRLSVISAISVSAKCRRLGLYFDIHDHNIVTDDFERFVERLLRCLQRRIILVIDRWSVHRSGARRLLRRFPCRVHIEWLPAYAPDLNPDEQVWKHTKYDDLANYIPDDIRALGRAICRSIRRSRGQQPLLRSFFQHAKLGW
ncbi:MAG: transposase [Planctomycetes bacterium]|nr:transposase [Planctomycetota bacterium]